MDALLSKVPVAEHFRKFHLTTHTYKIVNNHSIDLDVLVPKDIAKGLHPLIVRWHGGYLIAGNRQYPGFFPNWLLDFILENSAIVVNADYRLIPEANGLDVLEDLKDAYKWVQENLSAVLSTEHPGVEVDLTRMLSAGDSAGAYLAIQSGLILPSTPNLPVPRAILAAFPFLDLRDRFYTERFEKLIFGIPEQPASVVKDHLAQLESGSFVTSPVPPDRFEFMLGSIQQGNFGEYFGTNSVLYPTEQLSKVKTFPPIFIFHGKEDTAVPIVGSEKFVQELKKTHPDTEVKYTVRPGEHMFENQESVDADWLREGLKFVTKAWLAK